MARGEWSVGRVIADEIPGTNQASRTVEGLWVLGQAGGEAYRELWAEGSVLHVCPRSFLLAALFRRDGRQAGEAAA